MCARCIQAAGVRVIVTHTHTHKVDAFSWPPDERTNNKSRRKCVCVCVMCDKQQQSHLSLMEKPLRVVCTTNQVDCCCLHLFFYFVSILFPLLLYAPAFITIHIILFIIHINHTTNTNSLELLAVNWWSNESDEQTLSWQEEKKLSVCCVCVEPALESTSNSFLQFKCLLSTRLASDSRSINRFNGH